MRKKAWLTISLAKGRLDFFGCTALGVLAELVTHDEICQESDTRLCLRHAEISHRFNAELAWIQENADILKYEESFPE